MALHGTRSAFGHLLRRFSQDAVKSPAGPVSVKGLSTEVVRSPQAVEGPQVPGDKSGDYKVPEYFCYNTMSYYQAEIEMADFRLPQPTAGKK